MTRINRPRYLVLWQDKHHPPFVFEGPLPEGWEAAQDQITEWGEDYELCEVREVETGKECAADFTDPRDKPSAERGADMWIKVRKEDRAFS